VKVKGAVIIDSGAPKKWKAFLKTLEKIGIKSDQFMVIFKLLVAKISASLDL
jgi:hypothetical protein